MKNYFLLFTVLLTHLICAQEIKTSKDFKITNSTEYDVIDGTKHYISFGENVVAVKFTKKNVHVQRFEGDKVNLKTRKDYDALPQNANLSSVIKFNDKVLVIYDLYDKGTSSEQVFAFEIDPVSLKQSKTEKLFTTKRKVRGGKSFWTGNTSSKFIVKTSFNDDILMINYSLAPEVKNDKKSSEEIGFQVFDKKLKKVWSKDITMPESEKRMDISSACIDKNHKVHFLTKIFHDDSRKEQSKDGKLNHHWEVFNISGESNTIERTKIGLKGGKIFRSLSFFEGQDDEIIVAGYYADNAKSAMSGTFLIFMDNLGENSEAITTAFDVAEFKKYNKANQQKKIDKNAKSDDVSIANLRLRQIVLCPDGSITTAGEIYRVTTMTNSKGQTSTTYESLDIYAMNINREGQLNWFRKIPKSQLVMAQSVGIGISFTITKGLGELGFKLIMNGMDHYFIFLDNEKNIGLPTSSRPYTHVGGRGGFLTSYKIDQNGKLSQHSLLNLKDFNGNKLYQFEPSRIMPMSDGFAVEFYLKKKKDMMVRVRFTDSKQSKSKK